MDEHSHRADHRPGEPGSEAPPTPLAERVLVIARPEIGSQRLVRAAWRAARRLGAELDVVCPEGRLDEEAVRQRDLLRSLSVTLGAHFLPVADDALADAVVGLAGERGVTRLAMAAPRGGRGLVGRLRGDLLDTLLERLEGVDILLLAERRVSRDRPGEVSGMRVLVATDQHCPVTALRLAAALAGRDGEVVLASVLIVPHAQPLEAVLDLAVADACAVLDAGERAASGARLFDTRLVRARSFAEGVLEALAAEHFDVLVLEAPRGGLRNGVRGQFDTLMERAGETVVLVRPGPADRAALRP